MVEVLSIGRPIVVDVVLIFKMKIAVNNIKVDRNVGQNTIEVKVKNVETIVSVSEDKNVVADFIVVEDTTVKILISII